MKQRQIRNLVFSGLFVAIGMVLPFLTGQIPTVGSRLLPMHIPALLCGFACGPLWGLAVGLVTPLLRSMVFGMPPMMPTAVGMAAELAVYGLMTGLLYRALPKRLPYYYIGLVVSMVVGRIAWGVVSIPLYISVSKSFTWAMFWAGGFINAVPGMVLQVLVIPPLVLALQRAKVFDQ